MNAIKTILAIIGALVIAGAVVMYAKYGPAVNKLDPKAMGLYMQMFDNVLKTGNAAAAMTRVVKVNKDVNVDDMVESMKSIAEENGMLMVGDVTMFDGKTPLVKGQKPQGYTRIFSFCSRTIAATFLDYSKEFGAFMPCRIMLRQDANGDRWLITMDMSLMLHGGHPLSPEMLKLGQQVEKTIYDIQDLTAKGDF